MKLNRSHFVFAAATAFFVAACSDIATTPRGPGGPSYGKSGGGGTVVYSGQGLTPNGDGSYIINTEICGVANGADADGPYLLWVFTATGATSASITFDATLVPLTGTFSMVKSGNGTFKYISGVRLPLSDLIGHVTASVTGGSASNPQLTISHGCLPKRDLVGAWCSPGYWRNTLNFNPNGWTTIGIDPLTAAFNGSVSPDFYANDLSPDQLLTYVLNHPGDFGGSLGTAGPFGLTAFNAVGAYLTNQISGYQFDPSLVGNEDACPLDAHGDFKTVTP